MLTANRYHDISCGHRVHQHESKCAHLHGHNYRFHFSVKAPSLDSVGRVMDFSVIKEKLCMWLEDNWDHKFLLWEDDPLVPVLQSADPEGLVIVPFNPTAENMALYILNIVAPAALHGTEVVLTEVTIEETRKCSCTYNLEK